VELADTSAWAWSRRSAHPELRPDFDARLEEGELAICDMVRLELLYSARGPREFAELAVELDALPDCPIGEAQWKRALWVYGELARRGGAHQRSVKHPDLLVAAAAEAASVPVLHYGADFDRIARITGQEHRWLARRGSLS
jgi:predicted nucleic acid-binding protein